VAGHYLTIASLRFELSCTLGSFLQFKHHVPRARRGSCPGQVSPSARNMGAISTLERARHRTLREGAGTGAESPGESPETKRAQGVSWVQGSRESYLLRKTTFSFLNNISAQTDRAQHRSASPGCLSPAHDGRSTDPAGTGAASVRYPAMLAKISWTAFYCPQ